MKGEMESKEEGKRTEKNKQIERIRAKNNK
jgi:hypothetical protein